MRRWEGVFLDGSFVANVQVLFLFPSTANVRPSVLEKDISGSEVKDELTLLIGVCNTSLGSGAPPYM